MLVGKITLIFVSLGMGKGHFSYWLLFSCFFIKLLLFLPFTVSVIIIKSSGGYFSNILCLLGTALN